VFINFGAPIDLYSASPAFTAVDLGTWTPATTNDKAFRFTVVGKNARSAGYEGPLDFIQLTGM
jgi:hypothetical protein